MRCPNPPLITLTKALFLKDFLIHLQLDFQGYNINTYAEQDATEKKIYNKVYKRNVEEQGKSDSFKHKFMYNFIINAQHFLHIVSS